jgi:hypothetical protein
MAMNRADYLELGRAQARAENAVSKREVAGSWQQRAQAEGFNEWVAQNAGKIALNAGPVPVAPVVRASSRGRRASGLFLGMLTRAGVSVAAALPLLTV